MYVAATRQKPIKNLFRKASVAAATTALVVGCGVVGATAAAASPVAGPKSAGCSTSHIKISAIAKGTIQSESCGTTLGLALGAPAKVTAQQIQTSTDLTATQKAEMIPLATRGAITSNHWSQFTTGGAYTRTQNGTFYYDGSRVWVTLSYAGYTGSHSCFTNYSVGVLIDGKDCTESGSTTVRNMYSSWNVTPVPWGTYGAEMTAQLYPNGTISGFGGTVG